MNRVRKGNIYTFDPVLLDIMDRHAGTPNKGDKVRVIHPHGCPPPNTMGHCHVESLEGKFLGLVHCNSLTR